MKNRYFVTLIFIVSYFAYLQAELFVVRISNPSSTDVTKFTHGSYDIASCKPGEYLDLVVDQPAYKALLAEGYKLRITQTEAEWKENLQGEGDLDGYRDYDEVLTDLQSYEIQYPDICKLYDIGDSRGLEYFNNGNQNYVDYTQQIWAMKISDNAETEEDEPCIYYMGVHHAREPIGEEMVMTILEHLLINYNVNPDITGYIDNTQIWLIPLVNPNGHKLVTDGLNYGWRKNICDNNEDGNLDVLGLYYCDGVDLNRNYGWHWVGSNLWTHLTYSGADAFSEPETRAIRALLSQHHFIAGISYHTYGEQVIYSYGYEYGAIPPDQDALSELSSALVYSIPAQNGGNYTSSVAWIPYCGTTGTLDDYAYGTYGIFDFTIEMATEFIPPASQVSSICNDNLEATLILLDRINYSSLRGHVTDAVTGDPLQAEVFIESIDDTGAFRNPYLSDETFGSYYRFLTEGEYNVTFSAFGHESQSFTNISINAGNPTILDVTLNEASAIASISGIITDAETELPLENATVELLGHGIPIDTTNEQGEYQIDNLYSSEYELAVYADGYECCLETVEIIGQLTDMNYSISEIDDGTFESGFISNCWHLSGDSDWQIDSSEVYNGAFSIRSGSISDYQRSDIGITIWLPNDDEVSFARKVSSGENVGYLRFYVDNVLIDWWSGEENWEEVSYNISAGIHTFCWDYYEYYGDPSGSVCAWLDDIVLSAGNYLYPPSELIYAIPYPQTGDLWDICLEWLEPLNPDYLGYNLYKDGVLLNTALITDQEYIDQDYYGSSLEYYVTAVYLGGESLPSNIIVIDGGDWPLSVDQQVSLHTTDFYGNYPNPFNPTTSFKFSLAAESSVKLNIYNIRGQLMKQLLSDNLLAGMHMVLWDGTDENGKPVASGIYCCRLKSGEFQEVKKLVLMK